MTNFEVPTPSVGISFFTHNDLITQISFFSSQTFSCHIDGSPSIKKKILNWIEAYLSKREPQIDLPLDYRGMTPFTKKALKALQTISFGQTASYQDITNQIGSPRAARAIGNVCQKNRFLLVVPCHRIIRSNQTLGGFACGLPTKMTLLSFEGHVLNHSSKAVSVSPCLMPSTAIRSISSLGSSTCSSFSQPAPIKTHEALIK